MKPKPFTLCAARRHYFAKGKFKHSVYQSLFSIADLFAVVICDPVRDRHSRRLTCLFMHVLRALATLNQTSELDYSIWEGANNNNFLLFTNPLYKTLLTYTK